MPIVIIYPETVITRTPITKFNNNGYLSALEKKLFSGTTYGSLSTTARLDKIETEVLGKSNSDKTVHQRISILSTALKSLVNPSPYNVKTGEEVSQKLQQTVFKLIIAKSMQYDWDSTITQHPVENSASITDHIINNLLNFQVSIFLPNKALTQVIDANTNVQKTIQTQLRFVYYEQLLKLRDSRIPFSLVTTLSKFDYMIIEKVSSPVSIETGDGFQVDLNLKQIRIVNAEKIPWNKKLSKSPQTTKNKKKIKALNKSAGTSTKSGSGVVQDITNSSAPAVIMATIPK